MLKTEETGSAENNEPNKKVKVATLASTLEKHDPTLVAAQVPIASNLSRQTNDPFRFIKNAMMEHDSGMEKVHSFLLAHSISSSSSMSTLETRDPEHVMTTSHHDTLSLSKVNECSSETTPTLLEDHFDQLDHFIKSNDAVFTMKEDTFSTHSTTKELADTSDAFFSDLVFDWNLKTQLTILSPFSFYWLKSQHESESLSLFHFAQPCSDSSACSPVDSIQQCLYYWMFPFETTALSFMSYEAILGTVKGSKRDVVDHSLWQVSRR